METTNTTDYSLIAEYTRHGGAYDRGSADSWYGRDFQPHYFKGDTYKSDKVVYLTSEELEAYTQGYNETAFAQKEFTI